MYLHWLDRLPWGILLVAAIFLGFAPIGLEPHLIEKLKMLYAGSLSKVIDIFDLVLHGLPQVLLILKLIRTVQLYQKSDAES